MLKLSKTFSIHECQGFVKFKFFFFKTTLISSCFQSSPTAGPCTKLRQSGQSSMRFRLAFSTTTQPQVSQMCRFQLSTSQDLNCLSFFLTFRADTQARGEHHRKALSGLGVKPWTFLLRDNSATIPPLVCLDVYFILFSESCTRFTVTIMFHCYFYMA